VIRALVAAVALLAQAPDAARFDVASIKRNRSDSNAFGGASSRDTFRRTNATLLLVLLQAYRGRFLRWEAIGGPEWLDRDRFDVIAKTDGSPWTPAMVVQLLQDRFKLRTHEETRERDVYRLVMDRPGQLGPKLTKSPTTVEEDLKLPRDQRRCRYRLTTGRFDGKCASISLMLDGTLQSTVQRRVLDETGLAGVFDIDLTWDPTFELPADQRAPSDAPSIFTALREQLGLRLEPGKARVPVLVIDSVEPPTED
jgi:uncharacterized protein (TIGR03435 family)